MLTAMHSLVPHRTHGYKFIGFGSLVHPSKLRSSACFHAKESTKTLSTSEIKNTLGYLFRLRGHTEKLFICALAGEVPTVLSVRASLSERTDM